MVGTLSLYLIPSALTLLIAFESGSGTWGGGGVTSIVNPPEIAFSLGQWSIGTSLEQYDAGGFLLNTKRERS